MSLVLNIPLADGQTRVVKQEQLPQDPSGLIRELEVNRVAIKYWHYLSLLYLKNGDGKSFRAILQHALHDKDLSPDDSNKHFFENKEERFNAANCLASHWFTLYEVVKQRGATPDGESVPDADVYFHKGKSLIEESMHKGIYTSRGIVTVIFSQMMHGQMREAQNTVHNYDQGPDPLVAIAKVIIDYNEGNLQACLVGLRQILRANPNSPLDVWLALGIIYFKLNNLPKAKFAVEHVVEHDPKNAFAKTCLGIITLQLNPASQIQRDSALRLFYQSFELDDTNALTMKFLANHFFNAGEFEMAESLCKRALSFLMRIKKPEERADLRSEGQQLPFYKQDVHYLLGDIHFILAKTYHAQDRIDLAEKHYFDAGTFNQMNMAAQFGLAKVHFFNGNMTAAEECLKKITSDPKFKDCFDVIRLLASVKVKQKQTFEAFALYKRLLELNPNDYDSCYAISELFNGFDKPLALKYLEKGVAEQQKAIEISEKLQEDGISSGDQILKPHQMVISPHILNNLGVLRLHLSSTMKQKQNTEHKEFSSLALEAFKKGLASIEKLKALNKDTPAKLQAWEQTLKFSIGYWNEVNCQFDQAYISYQELIKENPDYSDAYLRLAHMAMSRDSFKKAISDIELSLKSKLKVPVLQNLIKGFVYTEMGRDKDADEQFLFCYHKLKGVQENYIFLGRAYLHWKKAMESEGPEQTSLLMRSFSKYSEVLFHDPTNCYAALGLANFLAYTDKASEAMEIFRVISAANDKMHQPLVNMAHLNCEKGKFDIAITQYRLVLEQYKPGDLKTELYLSKAHYLKNDFEGAKKILAGLMIRFPYDIEVRFNYAKTLYSMSVHLLNRVVSKVSNTVKAIENIQKALSIFKQLTLDLQTNPAAFFRSLTTESEKAKKQCEDLTQEVIAKSDVLIGIISDILLQSQDQLEHDRKELAEKERHRQEVIRGLQAQKDLEEKEAEEARLKQEEEQQLIRQQEEEYRRKVAELAFAQTKEIEAKMKIAKKPAESRKRTSQQKAGKGKKKDDDIIDDQEISEDFDHHLNDLPSENMDEDNELDLPDDDEDDFDFDDDAGEEEDEDVDFDSEQPKRDKKKKKKDKKGKKKKAHRLHRTDGDEDNFFNDEDEGDIVGRVGKKRSLQQFDDEEIGHHPRKRRHLEDDD